MALFRCKMCGGDLEVSATDTICTCEYCGTEQTVPKLDTEKKANLYDRANHFRRNNEFDRAMGIYEQILTEDSSDAEAYWSLVLCRYGIEYVEDPTTHKRVPTVHRTQHTSIFEDKDYLLAMEHADVVQKQVYQQEATAIDEIQKRILSISSKEEPFDVFICYKESDEQGNRTQDSVLAYDLYENLTREGLKVFYARVTLEDKLGQEYEPYIFSALNSSKVMVVIGTTVEYFNAVWVKNEWSRYLKLISSGSKKTLIPAYKGIDPYDLPEEFSHLQAQDMSKIGFMQDLVRGIKKIIGVDQVKNVIKETVVVKQSNGMDAESLLKRGNIELNDCEWDNAFDFFERALDQEPECAEAYLGELCVYNRVRNIQELEQYYISKNQITSGIVYAACPVAEDRINACISQNCVGGYLEKSQIADLFLFDRTFTSYYENWISLKNDQIQEFNNDKLLSRVKNFGNDELIAQIETMCNNVLQDLDRKIEDARTSDEQIIERIKENYENHLYTVEQSVLQMHEEALSYLENDYQKAISDYEAFLKEKKEDIAIAGLMKAMQFFHGFSGYKECSEYENKCADEIEKLKSRKKVKARINRHKSLIIVVCVVLAVFMGAKISAGIVKDNILNARLEGEIEELKNCNNYEIVHFGNYKKNSEWIVLDKQEDKVLLLSLFIVEERNFSKDNYRTNVWEKSDIRKWLNKSYRDKAFTKAERKMILKSHLTNSDNQNDTNDYVFLLSKDEIDKYLDSEEDRITYKKSAVERYADNISELEGEDWWLRSKGLSKQYISSITDIGLFNDIGADPFLCEKGIRPAIWVDISDLD